MLILQISVASNSFGFPVLFIASRDLDNAFFLLGPSRNRKNKRNKVHEPLQPKQSPI